MTPTVSAMVVPRRMLGCGASGWLAFQVLVLDVESVRVACKAFAQKMRVEPKLCRPIVPRRSPAIARRAQPPAHAPFRIFSQNEIAVAVDRSHRIQRGRYDLAVMQV